jgi:hypothetical protein
MTEPEGNSKADRAKDDELLLPWEQQNLRGDYKNYLTAKATKLPSKPAEFPRTMGLPSQPATPAIDFHSRGWALGPWQTHYGLAALVTDATATGELTGKPRSRQP